MASQKAIAQHLDLSTTRVAELQAGGLFPRDASLDEARVAYIRDLREKAAGRRSEDGLDLAGERARLAKEQADAQAMKNALQRGEQALIGEVEFAVTTLLSGVRERVRAIPDKVALEVAAEAEPTVCRDILARVLDDVLEEIADVRVEGLAAPDDASGDEEDH